MILESAKRLLQPADRHAIVLVHPGPSRGCIDGMVALVRRGQARDNPWPVYILEADFSLEEAASAGAKWGYHVTMEDSIASIARTGLRPSNASVVSRGDETGHVWFERTPEQAVHWAVDRACWHEGHSRILRFALRGDDDHDSTQRTIAPQDIEVFTGAMSKAWACSRKDREAQSGFDNGIMASRVGQDRYWVPIASWKPRGGPLREASNEDSVAYDLGRALRSVDVVERIQVPPYDPTDGVPELIGLLRGAKVTVVHLGGGEYDSRGDQGCVNAVKDPLTAAGFRVILERSATDIV